MNLNSLVLFLRLNYKVVVAVLVVCVLVFLCGCYFMRGSKKPNDIFAAEHFSSDGKPTCTLYHVDWCGHCQKVKPIWAELKDQYSDRINFADKDCEEDDNKELCKSEVSEGYPTIKFNGEEYTGERSKDALSQFFDDMLERLSSK